MKFVGVDLAWGNRHQTGLAELTAAGDLVTLTQRVTDSELLDWLATRITGPVLIAFDAPLIVGNDSGSRPAERTVGHYFGRRGASCHPTNRANPAFTDGGRAARLTTLLGMEVDAYAVGQRRAIEVYPHAAIIELFGLDGILRYKNKTGRSLDFRRTEMVRLMDLLESLGTAAVPLRVATTGEWAEVRRRVETAATKAALSRAEDSIDAVVCAYVALYSHRRPDRTAVFGSSADGHLVTPVGPETAARIDAHPSEVWPAALLHRGPHSNP